MNRKMIEITIDTNGEVQVEAHGYVGQECYKDTLPFEEALGVTTASAPKPEAARRQATAEQQAKAGRS